MAANWHKCTESCRRVFLVTGSGKYFRNVIIKPEDSICMIELDEKGENYRIVWGSVTEADRLPSFRVI